MARHGENTAMEENQQPLWMKANNLRRCVAVHALRGLAWLLQLSAVNFCLVVECGLHMYRHIHRETDHTPVGTVICVLSMRRSISVHAFSPRSQRP